MLKTLLAQVKEFKTPSILTPLCMIGEVICEMIIPVLMGRIVDLGIGGSDMNYIVRTGLIMLAVPCSDFCSVFWAEFSERKLRQDLPEISEKRCMTIFRHSPFPA